MTFVRDLKHERPTQFARLVQRVQDGVRIDLRYTGWGTAETIGGWVNQCLNMLGIETDDFTSGIIGVLPGTALDMDPLAQAFLKALKPQYKPLHGFSTMNELLPKGVSELLDFVEPKPEILSDPDASRQATGSNSPYLLIQIRTK